MNNYVRYLRTDRVRKILKPRHPENKLSLIKNISDVYQKTHFYRNWCLGFTLYTYLFEGKQWGRYYRNHDRQPNVRKCCF